LRGGLGGAAAHKSATGYFEMQDRIQGILHALQRYPLHPFVDHFSVALVLIAIAADLVASLFSNRPWLRYMALTLIILGAGSVALSNLTGGWDADRAWNAIKAAGGPTLATFKRHALIGGILPWVIAGLAVWRIAVQALSFAARSRPLYLVIAIGAGAAILYQGYLGGELVYRYGVGTALFDKAETAPPQAPALPAIATPMATVYVPPPTPAPTPSPTTTVAPTAIPPAASTASPSATASPISASGGSGSDGSGGTTITPPDARATL